MARKIDAVGAFYGSGFDIIVMWVMGMKHDPSYNFDITSEQAAELIDQLTIALHRKSLEYIDKT